LINLLYGKGLAAELQVRQAEGALAQVRASVPALEMGLDMENALSALVRREEQAAVLAQGVDSLGRARDASFAAYQKGVVSLIEVLQADENFLRASDARAQAQAESARAAVTAFRALGGGWQPIFSNKNRQLLDISSYH